MKNLLVFKISIFMNHTVPQYSNFLKLNDMKNFSSSIFHEPSSFHPVPFLTLIRCSDPKNPKNHFHCFSSCFHANLMFSSLSEMDYFWFITTCQRENTFFYCKSSGHLVLVCSLFFIYLLFPSKPCALFSILLQSFSLFEVLETLELTSFQLNLFTKETRRVEKSR